MEWQSSLKGHDLVAIGTFAPGMFHPQWLARHSLISEKEAESSKIDIVSDEVTNFSTGDWLSVQVLPSHIQFLCTLEPYFDTVRDLMSSIFRILHHSTITSIGINWTGHYAVSNEETWHKIGNELAPKQLWEPFVRRPDLKNVTIEDVRDDDRKGNVHYIVQPSTRFTEAVFLQLNDHFERSAIDTDGTDWAVEVLTAAWAESKERFDNFRNGIESIVR